MHFANENWGMAWAILVTILATALALTFFAVQMAPTGPASRQRLRVLRLLRLRIFFGVSLLLLAMLPVATTFPPLMAPPPPPEPTTAELTGATIAHERAMARLVGSQRALVDEMRQRPVCPACSDRLAPPSFPRRILGSPFSLWSLIGFAALFGGLWLAFDGSPSWPPNWWPRSKGNDAGSSGSNHAS